MKYWDIAYETLDREVLKAVQLKRLQELVKYVYGNVPFYNEKMNELNVKPDDIKSLEDITKLPFTEKEDLRKNYPDGLFATSKRDIVRIHASSGTTGKPTVVAYTKEDIDLWQNMMARALYAGGVTAADIFQIAYGYGLFTGGLGFHYGAERIGAIVIPVSGGNTAKQLMLMQDLKTTVLACTPSYAIYLGEEALKRGIDIKNFGIKEGFFGGEPWSENIRKKIEELWDIKAYDHYGLSEIIGPGVAFECSQQNGLHINEDHFYPEIVDSKTLEPVPDGEVGELVITTLTKKGMPLLRYRTKDLTKVISRSCECGRTLVKIHRIMGRADDMLIIRGVNVFPSQIEEALLSVEEVQPHYMIIVDRINSMDVIEVQVEVNENVFSDEIKDLEAFEIKVKNQIENILGISVSVKLVAPNTIERFSGKAKRVIDKRVF